MALDISVTLPTVLISTSDPRPHVQTFGRPEGPVVLTQSGPMLVLSSVKVGNHAWQTYVRTPTPDELAVWEVLSS